MFNSPWNGILTTVIPMDNIFSDYGSQFLWILYIVVFGFDALETEYIRIC